MDEDDEPTILRDLTGRLEQLVGLLERAGEMLEQDADTPLIREVLRRALAVTRGSVRRVRTAIGEASEGALAGRSFFEALEELLDSELVEDVAQLDVEHEELGWELSSSVREALLEVARRAVIHFVALGEADQLSVSYGPSDDGVALVVSDEATGFAPDESGEETGGLAAIRRRVREVGGDLALETSWREGTRIIVTIPRSQAEETAET